MCRSTIRDKIIPHAVSWFTGEALQGDEFEDIEEDDEDDEEGDEDEDEEDEDDDDDEEDDDEEEEKAGKSRKKVIRKNFRAKFKAVSPSDIITLWTCQLFDFLPFSFGLGLLNFRAVIWREGEMKKVFKFFPSSTFTEVNFFIPI